MKVETPFIKNDRYLEALVIVWIFPDRQKKHKSIKEMMEWKQKKLLNGI
jgi:hypothetical protein